ncbi:hypothetical protein KCU90_g399, partial [Aureobasidium melanogenum]
MGFGGPLLHAARLQAIQPAKIREVGTDMAPSSIPKRRGNHLVLEPTRLARATQYQFALLLGHELVLGIGQHPEQLQLRHLVADHRALGLDTCLQFGDAFRVLGRVDLLREALDLIQLLQLGLVRLLPERLVLERLVQRALANLLVDPGLVLAVVDLARRAQRLRAARQARIAAVLDRRVDALPVRRQRLRHDRVAHQRAETARADRRLVDLDFLLHLLLQLGYRRDGLHNVLRVKDRDTLRVRAAPVRCRHHRHQRGTHPSASFVHRHHLAVHSPSIALLAQVRARRTLVGRHRTTTRATARTCPVMNLAAGTRAASVALECPADGRHDAARSDARDERAEAGKRCATRQARSNGRQLPADHGEEHAAREHAGCGPPGGRGFQCSLASRDQRSGVRCGRRGRHLEWRELGRKRRKRHAKESGDEHLQQRVIDDLRGPRLEKASSRRKRRAGDKNRTQSEYEIEQHPRHHDLEGQHDEEERAAECSHQPEQEIANARDDPGQTQPFVCCFFRIGIEHEIDLLVIAVERLVDAGRRALPGHTATADRPAAGIATTRGIGRVLDGLRESGSRAIDSGHDLLLIDAGTQRERERDRHLQSAPRERRHSFVRFAAHDRETIGEHPDRDARGHDGHERTGQR